MKKIFLLGALVASTMAFASSNIGSVTVKGQVMYDANSTPSLKVVDDSSVTEQNKTAYDTARKGFKDIDSVSTPSFGGGLEVEYSIPVYKINDNMAVLVAGGLQGGVEYGKFTQKAKTVSYDKSGDTHKFAEKEEDVTRKLITSSVAVFAAPKFEYKINDELKVAAGVKLGLGADIHTILADTKVNDSIKQANDDYSKDTGSSKPTTKYGDTSTSNTDKDKQTDVVNVGKTMSERSTNAAFVVPIFATADVDYNNIIVSVDLGGKVLFPNEKDFFSCNVKQELKYNAPSDKKAEGEPGENSETQETSPQAKPVEPITATMKYSPKFIFSAGLKVGYRFDLSKFIK